MKSFPPSCATSWSPTISPTSASKRDWTIPTPSASASKPSPPALPASRRNGSTPAFAGAGNVDFPLLQRLALPITIGAVRYPGIKIHDPRVIRLLEVLLHGGSHVGGWTAKQIHHAVLTTFDLSDSAYRLNQLRYDLRKLSRHGLLQRDGSRYAYRLTPKGFRWRCSFSSSTNASAARSPIAASTTPTPITSRPASSKPPTTAPTTPLNRSSICWPPDLSVAIVELFLSTILGARIYDS